MSIKEGTWSLPDTVQKKAALKKLMSKPIELGREGDKATKALYNLLGDDELFDALYDAGKKDPKGDARPYVKSRMKALRLAEMSEKQMKKREEIVKSMKKSKGEFKDRYGDKADDVMYATATKMAMKSESVELDEAEDTHKTKDGGTAKKGLYYYINKKKKEGRKANPAGHEDRPTEDDFKAAAKTAKEEVEYVSESVIDDLRKIVKTKSAMPVKFANGAKTKVDMFTASAMVKVHDALKQENQKKFADSINKDETMFMKMMDFAMKAVK